jgi:hypothetical protein
MRRWLIIYAALAVGTVVALLLVIWAVGGFSDMGLSGDGQVALILGVGFTVFLSFGLMGLAFYSDRSGHDETVMDGHSSPHTQHWKNDRDGSAGGGKA